MRVRLVISDAHEGLKAARLAVFGDALWQRCQFHLPPIKPQQNAPKLAAWLEESLPEGLTVLSFPEPHRRLLRTTNGVERVSREIKRRTQVASIFPNEASCLRLVSALLMETSDDWQAGKAYLTFSQ